MRTTGVHQTELVAALSNLIDAIQGPKYFHSSAERVAKELLDRIHDDTDAAIRP